MPPVSPTALEKGSPSPEADVPKKAPPYAGEIGSSAVASLPKNTSGKVPGVSTEYDDYGVSIILLFSFAIKISLAYFVLVECC